MIVVIQCAASKQPDYRSFIAPPGKRVHFVANPDAAPPDPTLIYARPDDIFENGKTWRDRLLEYNRYRESNPNNLYPAYMLYENRAYFQLVGRFTVKGVYILSAGWGLVPADFLLPHYDITFSPSADPYKRRRKSDSYNDFRLLPDDTDDQVVFFGGKDYLPLFCELTAGIRGPRTVFYNSATRPDAPGCKLVRYETATRTNWHYECANTFLDGKITL
jgi:hypothetical protein